MDDDKKVSGSYVKLTLDHIEATYNDAEKAKIYAKIPKEKLAAMRAVKIGDWYPLSYAVDLLDGIYTLQDTPAAGEAALAKCGEAISMDAAQTFLKLVTKVLTPRLLVSKFPDIWRRYHNFGKYEVDFSEFDSNRFTITCTGYDYVAPMGVSWIYGALLSLGLKPVITSNCPSGTKSVPEVVWSASWT